LCDCKKQSKQNEKCLFVIPVACKCMHLGLFVKRRKTTSTLTCSRSCFSLWCTQKKSHSHNIQREQNGESRGVCAHVEKEGEREREREREGDKGKGSERQRDRDSETEKRRESEKRE
jgi:hypothetical protein